MSKKSHEESSRIVKRSAAPGPQASAVAELSAREGAVSLHQLPHTDPRAKADDIYATPVGAPRGYRIAADGQINEIGETLSARI